jgi:aminoglycoside phosphotransferase (APT) family kinase protein
MSGGDWWSEAALTALGLPHGTAARLLGEGQLSTAVLVEPNLVVRFPKHALGVEHLARERTVVGLVADRVDVALPLPGPANLALPPPRAYTTHKLVPGTVLDSVLVASLTGDELDDFLAQLTLFLERLRSVTEDATAAGIPVLSLTGLATVLGDEVAALLAPRMSRDQTLRAAAELDRLARVSDGEPVLCHGDLGGALVWDSEAGGLGVIDWGAAVVSDPVQDLASLAALSPEVAAVVGDRVPHLRHRAEDALAVRATFALQEVLYAARQQDWQHVARVLREY